MIKLVWYIIKIGVIIALAVWLADEPGKVSLVWQGYSVETSAAVLVVAVFLLVAACLLAYRLVRLLRYGPRGIKIRRRLHQQQQGLERLGQGYAALAAGDAAAAGKAALAARKQLGGNHVLTQWLQAQAAQLAGDQATATTIFTQLAQDKAHAALGYRGLIGTALRQNNNAQAAVLLEDLAKAQPKAPWLDVARYEVASRQGDWGRAAQALRRAGAQKLLEVADAGTREAALLLAEARTAVAQQEMPRALQLAEQAQGKAPDWLPARIELVRTLLAAGYIKPALKRVEKLWDVTPHPELGALYLRALGEEAPLKLFKRVEQLTRNTLQHPASLLLLARTATAAGLWGEATRHLQRAITLAPTRQMQVLAAELAEKENRPPNLVRDALRAAAQAPADPAWRCQSCGHETAQWEINCPACGAQHSILWHDAHAAPRLEASPQAKPA